MPAWWIGTWADRYHLVEERSAALRSSEAGVEIGDDVLDRFDADREPDESGMDAGARLLLLGELAVRGGGGVDHQAADVADVRNVRVELEGFDDADRERLLSHP